MVRDFSEELVQDLGVRNELEFEKVARVAPTELAAFSPVVAGTPPHPHPQAGVLPVWLVGGGHTRMRERGWGSPSSDEGICTVVLLKYIYFVAAPIGPREIPLSNKNQWSGTSVTSFFRNMVVKGVPKIEKGDVPFLVMK
jgi:hypothetical protein